MAGRVHYSISPDDLRAIAREATSDHLQHGTSLTDSVVKAASLFDRPMTSEHVRRVCEMAYHDTFERSFREKTAGTDQYVSFDPPDAVAAAERIRTSKVASTQRVQESHVSHAAPILEKVASRSARRHVPVNAFDELMKTAQVEDPSEVLWYNPLSEVISVRDRIKDAIEELEVKVASLENAEVFSFLDLAGQAYQQYKEGSGISSILHACTSPLDMGKYASSVVPELLDELLQRLENEGCAFSDEKVASGRVNPNHPLPSKFLKMAESRNERAHVEYALSELRSEYDRVNGELRALCE